jgi:hypothetical protein
VRIHLREKWVSNLSIALANRFSVLAKADEEMTPKCKNFSGFFIWNKAKPYDVADIDPNYMIRSMFPKSPFHASLHKWLQTMPEGGVPFHIDIHGKYNRSEDRFLDLGTASIENEFP